MAASTAFKQQCPSCEAMVTIRDPALIGRKVDCPKCKYRFVVEKPAPEEEPEEEEAPAAEKKPVKKAKPEAKNGNGVKAPAKGKNGEVKKVVKKKVAAEDDEDEGEDEEKPGKKDGKAKKKKKKPAAEKNNKMMLGIGLAAVGVVVLCIAGYFMFIKPKKETGTTQGQQTNNTGPQNPGNQGAGQNQGNPNEGNPKEENPGQPGAENAQPTTNIELTNRLLPGTDHVAYVHFQDLLDSDLGEVLKRQLPEGVFAKHLGFSYKDIKDLIRTESYQENWALNFVHLTKPVNLDDVRSALGSTATRDPIKNHEYFVTEGDRPWLDQLGRLTLTKAGKAGSPVRKGPLAVHKFDDQTLVFGDEVAVQKFLECDRQPKQTPRKAKEPKKKEEQPKAGPGPGPGPMGGGSGGGPPPEMMRMYQKANSGMRQQNQQEEEKPKEEVNPLEGAYLTVDPQLGGLLARLEKPKNLKGKVLYVSATLRGGSAANVKQFWDITQWFNQEPAGVDVVGSALVQKDGQTFQYQNGLTCKNGNAAQDLSSKLRDKVGPDFAKFFTDITGIKIAVLKETEPEENEENQGGGNQPNAGPPQPPAFPRGPNGPMGGGSGGGPPPPQGGSASGPPRGGSGGGPPRMSPEMYQKFMQGGGRGGPPRPNQGNNPANEEKPAENKDETGIHVTQEGKNVFFTVKLVLKEKEKARLKGIASLVIIGLQGELEVAEANANPKLREFYRSRLAYGVGALGKADKGFPPGALNRAPGRERSGYPWEPNKRVSWMARLLPYMGHNELSRSINPEASWDDTENLVAARTLVPEFLDPGYPAESRYVTYPGARIGMAATHYVGIAGVGEDAAEPSTDPKNWGVFGYDRATPLTAMERGAGNTAVVIQVPPTYGSPWLAGGGSTVRGVPEKHSIKPFVSVTGPQGERGTYVLMGDGSVRFVSEKVSDEVFKAMVRLKGPAPKEEGWSTVASPPAKLPEKK